MAIPRPKILTRITVPTGGWDMKIYLSDPGGGQYDTAVTATVAAGDYFMSGDGQSDDFLAELTTKMNAAIVATGAPFDAGSTIGFDIHPTSHKVRMKFIGADYADATGDNDVKLAWTECDADLCAALGFDASADDTSTATDKPVFTADWHISHSWFADEDGQLADLPAEDMSHTNTIQATSISGKTKSQYFGERFASSISLQQLERDTSSRTKVFSQGIGYGTASVHPYNRNEPLECWWEEARKGVEFRVYRNGNMDTTRAEGRGTSTAGDATTTTDASQSWETDPQRWAGRIYMVDAFGGGTAITQSWYIESHTSTVLTFNNKDHYPHLWDTTYFLFDMPYQTYVLDVSKMRSFAPKEIPKIDRYNIDIPLKRYVA